MRKLFCIAGILWLVGCAVSQKKNDSAIAEPSVPSRSLAQTEAIKSTVNWAGSSSNGIQYGIEGPVAEQIFARLLRGGGQSITDKSGKIVSVVARSIHCDFERLKPFRLDGSNPSNAEEDQSKICFINVSDDGLNSDSSLAPPRWQN